MIGFHQFSGKRNMPFRAQLSHQKSDNVGDLLGGTRENSITENAAKQEGLFWVEPTAKATLGTSSPITASNLPDSLPEEDAPITVLSEHSQKPFRITAPELKRYRKLNVPLPRLAYDERMNLRAGRAGGISLFERTCSKSGKKLLSCHPPDAPYPVWDRELFELERS